ncbi:site-specific integrase [Aliarcobacter butzleri]|uniref:tyrosine-type recombinase/integrase n=1 Tax=Aliarcobacter butzleri TaxID=28197 RepID=UPI000F483AF1|nr:tyrosine-type recombinase/integrase [Aliarcobacter butzleri]MCT7573931.1 site-specific integrase [Aliarcobacter butzleri]
MHKITQPKLFSRGSKLWIRFSFNSQNIRKPLNLEDTKENRKLANLQIIPQILLKVYEGTFFENTNNIPTVDEYMIRSFELHKGGRSDSTNLMYKRNYNKHIKNVFGNIPLDKITSEDITHWQNNLKETEHLAKGSILRIRSCLNVMFEDAIENDLIQKNPISKAKKLRETDNPKVKRVKLKPFNLMEIKSILDVLEDSDKNLIATLFFTGMRAGECIGLKWEYIDFNKKTISIREQMVNGEQKQILKTTKSQRIIPMIEALIPYLENQYKLTGKQNSYVFLTARTNKHYHSAGKIREQIWVKALKKANIPYRNLHQTRGTFISTLISNGEDINYVSKIAGHENVKVTLEKYSEYIPCKNKDFGNCFG